jgi:peroxiredoxin
MRFKFLIVFVLAAFASTAQTGYKLDFKIQGLKDTTVFLGYYLFENTMIKDTARVDKNGFFSYDGKKTLDQGTYFLVLNAGKDKLKLFDFMMSADQHFALETSTEDYNLKMKVTGDEDNKIFFENMAFTAERQKEVEPFIKILKDSTLKDEQKKAAREGFKNVSTKVFAHQNELIAKYPASNTARLFKATKELEIPDPPKKADGSIDSSFQFRYYRDHYFDNFNLADDANLRQPRPFYRDKVYDYLDRLVVPNPDSITKAVEKLVAKAKSNKETYKYLVWTCIGHYQTPKIMGLDEVYVNLVDKYLVTGEMDYWLDANTKKSIVDYANKVRLAMIGRTAPNLMMQDQNMQPRSMYDIKSKYTILFIFDPDCGHCREESPKLVDFYNKNKAKLNLEIFAVSADTSMQKMKDYIKEMKMPFIVVNGPRSYVKTHFQQLYFSETTPSLYIIDEKKKIIARKLNVEDLGDFFQKHENFLKKQASGNKGS